MNFIKIEKHSIITFIIIITIIIIIIYYFQTLHLQLYTWNNIPTLYTVAGIQLLQYMAHIMLFLTLNLLHSRPVLTAVSVPCQFGFFLYFINVVLWYLPILYNNFDIYRYTDPSALTV